MDDIAKLLQAAAAERVQEARSSGPTVGEAREDSFLTFRLGESHFAVPLASSRGIVPVEKWTPLPGNLPYFAGVINWQGRLLTLVDIQQFFVAEPGLAVAGKTAVVIYDGDLEAGILVDEVLDILKIRSDQRLAVSSSLSEKQRKTIAGLYPISGQKLMAILNVAYLLRAIAGEERD